MLDYQVIALQVLALRAFTHSGSIILGSTNLRYQFVCPAIFGGPPQPQKQLGHHTVCALLRHEASEVGNTPKSNQGWIPP